MKNLLIITAAMIGLSGCVIVPFPMPSKTHTEALESQDVRFIEEGETTQAKVEADLGMPTWTFDDPERWVYLMREYTGGRWNACIAIGAGYSGYVDCGPVSDGETRFKILEIEFDEVGIVAREDKDKLAHGDCTKSELCMDIHGRLVESGELADALLADSD